MALIQQEIAVNLYVEYIAYRSDFSRQMTVFDSSYVT
jgi:hypothetical protein